MKGFALLSCFLFFLFQVYSLLFSRQQFDSSTYQLQIVSPESLILVKTTGKTVNKERNQTVPGFSAYSAPFFFKPVPINYCDEALLLSITGIGPELAGNILKTRERIGLFKDKHDLLQVSGIGESRMNRFSQMFSFEIQY